MRKSGATSVLSLSRPLSPHILIPSLLPLRPSRMPGTGLHRTFLHQSGVVTERGLFLHTSPPTNKSQFTLPLSLLALPALLVRSSSHLERGDSTGNAGMRLRSNRKRTVIFRTRLHPEQSEASLWSVVSTPSPALDCTAFLSLGVFSPTL